MLWKLAVFTLLVPVIGAETLQHRSRRHLVFPMGGVYKLVLGIGIPAQLGLKQSMGFGVNLQFQYTPLLNISTVRTYPPIITRSREKRDELFQSDRSLFYLGVEAIMDKHGINGRQCLLKSICENAMNSLNHHANGLYGEILDIVLTPLYNGGSPDIEEVYVDAQEAGNFGVDCITMYPECLGDGLMEMITVLDY